MVFDAKLINPFLAATKFVFESMAGMKVENQKLYLKKEKFMKGDITALISLGGSNIAGVFAISFSSDFAISIIEKVLGVKYNDINTPEVMDAVGEMTNMIFGHAKKKLNEQEVYLQKSIPSVISGKSHIIAHFTNQAVLGIPFTSEMGDFFLEISIELLNNKKEGE